MATDVTPSPSKPASATPAAETTPPAPATVAPKPPESEADVIHIPSYSRWFSWKAIHECEVRFVPEFFDGRFSSKNPRAYKYYRNAIIRRFREKPAHKITFSEVRKTIVGDVGSIRRVFDFLEAWGLINYTGGSISKQPQQLKWEDKETKSVADAAAAGGADVAVPKKTLCSSCKTLCTIACFASDKHDMTLCARCFVRNDYRVGLSSSDFKRVEISEAKTDWSDKETLQLLEAIMHYGDDWKKISEHVGGRSVKECVARFIKLPFAEQFGGPPESRESEIELGVQSVAKPNKRQCLSPLADASNPIMAQAAFLSTLVGVDVAEAAARAAVSVLSDVGDVKHQENLKPPPNTNKQPESDDAPNLNNLDPVELTLTEAKSQLEKEEDELEKAVSGITDETKGIEEHILNFEEFDLQMEKKRQQIQHLQDLLFVDQLSLLFHKPDARTNSENTGEALKSV